MDHTRAKQKGTKAQEWHRFSIIAPEAVEVVLRYLDLRRKDGKPHTANQLVWLKVLQNKQEGWNRSFNGDSGILCVSPRHHVGRNTLSNVAKVVAAKMGFPFPELRTGHNKRHTAATLAAESGMPAEQMLRFFGWSNINIAN